MMPSCTQDAPHQCSADSRCDEDRELREMERLADIHAIKASVHSALSGRAAKTAKPLGEPDSRHMQRRLYWSLTQLVKQFLRHATCWQIGCMGQQVMSEGADTLRAIIRSCQAQKCQGEARNLLEIASTATIIQSGLPTSMSSAHRSIHVAVHASSLARAS